MHASDYQTFLKQLQKRVPDYLATTKANVNAMQVAYSYGVSVVDQKSAIKIQTVSHGRLKLTWQADGGEKIQLPIVNGKNMTHFKLCRAIMAQCLNHYFIVKLAGLGA